MYKGYCVSEQEVVATKKTIFCLFALRRGLAPLHSRVLFTPICPTLALLKGLWMSQLQFTSSTRNRRKHLGIWWGRDVSGTECTSQSRNRRGSKVHLLLTLFLQWRGSIFLTRRDERQIYTHIESTTSVFLCPLLSSCSLTSFLLFPPCGVMWLLGQLYRVLTAHRASQGFFV